MSVDVEIDERGSIQLPDDVLAMIMPHTRFVIEMDGERVILHPHDKLPPRLIADPVKRAEAVRRWAAPPRPSSPPLTDAMLSRDNMYD